MSFSTTDKNIHYLHPYYPTRFIEHNGISKSILAFKNGQPNIIEKFTAEMKDAFLELPSNEISKFSEMHLVVVPSHSEKKWSGALLQMAKGLCQELGMIDYSCALVRTTEHEKLTDGGDRSIDSHISTIRCNPAFDVEGKHILLLDDVTTTGNSIIAASRILKNAGAGKISAVTIGKTIKGTMPSDSSCM